MRKVCLVELDNKQEKVKGKNAKIGHKKLILENEEWKWISENERLEKARDIGPKKKQKVQIRTVYR